MKENSDGVYYYCRKVMWENNEGFITTEESHKVRKLGCLLLLKNSHEGKQWGCLLLLKKSHEGKQ